MTSPPKSRSSFSRASLLLNVSHPVPSGFREVYDFCGVTPAQAVGGLGLVGACLKPVINRHRAAEVLKSVISLSKIF